MCEIYRERDSEWERQSEREKDREGGREREREFYLLLPRVGRGGEREGKREIV